MDKAKFLGMNHGTASNRLKVKLLYQLAWQLGLTLCYRCGKGIDNADVFSIDHKQTWLNVDKKLFWDLNNVAFSHKKCNSAAASKEYQTSKTKCPKGHEYTESNTKINKDGWRRCRQCANNNAKEYIRKRRLNNKNYR